MLKVVVGIIVCASTSIFGIIILVAGLRKRGNDCRAFQLRDLLEKKPERTSTQLIIEGLFGIFVAFAFFLVVMRPAL